MLAALALGLLQAGGSGEAAEVAGPWTWRDFPVFVWRQRYRGRELPAELIEPFGGTNVQRDEEADWVRAAGYAFYVTNAAGRDDLHLDADEAWEERVSAWRSDPEEDDLVRRPCLTDPATVERLRDTLDRTRKARGGEHGFGLSLGDEIGLTPNDQPFDLCRSETCEALWRSWAAERGWPAVAPTTGETLDALAGGDASRVGAWLARRRFHREVVADLVRELAARVPESPVGLLGIRPETAFSGFPLRGTDVLGFLEVYPSPGGAAIWTEPKWRLATVFVQEGSPDDVAWQAWEHWLNGADGLVAWSDAHLEDRPMHRRRLARTVARIRQLQEEFPDPVGDGRVLVVSDPDSGAASWLRDATEDGTTWVHRRPSYQLRHGSHEVRLRSWIALLEDAGLGPTSMSLEEFLDDESWGSMAVVLPGVLVVDDAQVERLEDLLEEGLRVIVDGELGWIVRRGRRRKEDLAARLAREHPGAVLQAPEDVAHYLESRYGDGESGALRFLRRALAPERSGVSVRVSGRDASTPFLVRYRSRPGGSDILLVGLQNLRTEPERGRWRKATRVEVQHTAGVGILTEGLVFGGRPPVIQGIDWIFPSSPDEPLPPGEALLLRIRRGSSTLR
jgi:hypothetical protein